jgi:CRISPR-associated protein (TIGR03984 family)
MSGVYGCRLSPLDAQSCRAWFDWVLGTGSASEEITSPAVALFHCDDGVTWGHLGERSWTLGSRSFPEVSPHPTPDALQEMRIFCEICEVLVWRRGASFAGRVLRDWKEDLQAEVRPADEMRVLMGGRWKGAKGSFTLVHDGTGSQQALPLQIAQGDSWKVWPKLRVRHYFTQDDASGIVRIAASRLVGFEEAV